MTTRSKKRLRRFFITLIIIYFAGVLLLFLGQDFLLFHGVPLGNNHKFGFTQPFEEINIQRGNGNLSLVKFSTQSPKKGTVLFFHGNMKNVEYYAQYPIMFTKKGYEVWMIDYPGFGKTTGRRTEERLYADALLMYEKAIPAGDPNILIYGKSIGTGVAAYLASVRNCRQLILETPYYSIDELAKNYFPVYPVVPMTRYSLPIYQYLKKVDAPITIFHGTNDRVVPYKQALRLKNEKKDIHLITIENGAHNNLAGYKIFQVELQSLLGQ